MNNEPLTIASGTILKLLEDTEQTHDNSEIGHLKVQDLNYQGADKSSARPGRKQARKNVRDRRDLKNVEKPAVIKLFSLQGKAPKEIHAILTETLACFLHGLAKDLSVPLYILPDYKSTVTAKPVCLKRRLH